jgi:hypothetical protein
MKTIQLFQFVNCRMIQALTGGIVFLLSELSTLCEAIELITYG